MVLKEKTITINEEIFFIEYLHNGLIKVINSDINYKQFFEIISIKEIRKSIKDYMKNNPYNF